jgi:DNA invertase Pin-like site-specific DNA recombinase
VFAALAEFERDLIGERTAAGLAAARASTGMASLIKLFHTPETNTAVVVRDREYPQDPSML